MKVYLPWLDEGGLNSSVPDEDGKSTRTYRVRNGIAHINAEDWEGWSHTSHLRITPHPFDPIKKLRNLVHPEVLDMEGDPVFVDDPEDAGDYSGAPGATNDPQLRTADFVKAIGNLSSDDRDAIVQALLGSQGESARSSKPGRSAKAS